MWSTAVDDLRTLLSDGPEDRLQYRKKCIGEVNGTNTIFKTFEFRRLTDFSMVAGVWKSGIVLPVSGISSDTLSTGEFELVAPPTGGDEIEATYYTQWFTDAEITTFLQTSSRWLASSTDFSSLPDGLIPSALKYAASEAYLKMSMKWRQYMSETYKTEDQPGKPGTSPTSEFIKMAETFRKQATTSRDEYFTRQGRSLQPLTATIRGNIKSTP